MTYNRNIPQPTDNISVSQGDLLTNFQQIDSGTTGTGVGFARNHITMTDATNGGLHNRVDFFSNLSDPTISGFVSSLYPKSVSAISQLFFRNGSVISQITGLQPSTTGATSGVTGYQLSNGIIINYSSSIVAFTTTGAAITFQTTFPYTTGYVVIPVAEGSSPSVALSVVNSSLTQFIGYTNAGGGSSNCYFLAVGY